MRRDRSVGDYSARFHRRQRVAAVALAGLIGLGANANARDVAEVVNDRSPGRQTALEAGARQEGLVSLYTTGTQIEPLITRFREKYPFIRIEEQRLDPPQAAARAITEYEAGIHAVDGFELTSFSLAPLRAQKMLASIYSPEMAALDPNAVGPDAAWVVARESYAAVGYNPAKTSTAETPKSYADLLAPSWKGRMAIVNSSTAVAWVAVMEMQQGAEFVRRFKSQNVRVYNVTARALANFVISGEVALSPTIYNSHVIASKAAGAAIEWTAPGPVAVNDSAIAIAAQAPHPNAMTLLADFLLSSEGQALYETLGYNSPRRDRPHAGGDDLKKVYLSKLPDFEQRFESWTQLYEETFQ